jgi:hypothetical protein
MPLRRRRLIGGNCPDETSASTAAIPPMLEHHVGYFRQ